MDSAILEQLLQKKVERERAWLKERGLHTHISSGEVHIGLLGGDAYENGEIRIGALAIIGKTARHELAHRAHIERSFVPTKKLRKQDKYPAKFPTEFGAISEMLAAMVEHETMDRIKLERVTKKVFDECADTPEMGAAIIAARKSTLEMWKDLRRVGLGRREAHKAILHALYNSKTLTDLEIYRNMMKHYAELRKAGVNTTPSEVLAMRGLAKWQNGGRLAQRK